MQMKSLNINMGSRIGFLLFALALASLMVSCEEDIHPEVDMDPFEGLIVKTSVAEDTLWVWGDTCYRQLEDGTFPVLIP